MVARVGWVDPVLCASEHEAAFLESDLLERHPTRYNRTLGMESCVWLRLDCDATAPGLEVVHDVSPDDGAEWFGPYLGWEPARQAAAGLLRLYPLRYSGAGISRSERELARSLRVSPSDRAALAAGIRNVLRRDAGAVRAAVRSLERLREAAAAGLMFENAAATQAQIRGLEWITEPQKLAAMHPVDADYSAASSSGAARVGVVLSLRRGRLAQRQVVQLEKRTRWKPLSSESDHAWNLLAQQNADLMAKLSAADAIGPLSWRYGTRLMSRSAT
jgi:excinuclease ABC subunit C